MVGELLAGDDAPAAAEAPPLGSVDGRRHGGHGSTSAGGPVTGPAASSSRAEPAVVDGVEVGALASEVGEAAAGVEHAALDVVADVVRRP